MTTLGLNASAASTIGWHAVAMAASAFAASNAAMLRISAGSSSGSSPCTLTTISSSASPSATAASASRSVPVAWSWRVMHAAMPYVRDRRAHALVVGGHHDARRAALQRALGHPHDHRLARDVGERLARQPRRRVPRGNQDRKRHRGQRCLFGGKPPRLLLQHHRNAVADRIREARRLRDELLLLAIVDERTLGHRAHQHLKQFGIHGSCSPRGRPARGRASRARGGTNSARRRSERILPRPSASSARPWRRRTRDRPP